MYKAGSRNSVHSMLSVHHTLDFVKIYSHSKLKSKVGSRGIVSVVSRSFGWLIGASSHESERSVIVSSSYSLWHWLVSQYGS